VVGDKIQNVRTEEEKMALWQFPSGYFSLPLPVLRQQCSTHILSNITDTVQCQYLTTLVSNANKKK